MQPNKKKTQFKIGVSTIADWLADTAEIVISIKINRLIVWQMFG